MEDSTVGDGVVSSKKSKACLYFELKITVLVPVITIFRILLQEMINLVSQIKIPVYRHWYFTMTEEIYGHKKAKFEAD
jgi:activator of HSP90 ATPase